MKKKRPLSKSKSRWKGNIKIDLKGNLYCMKGVTEFLSFPGSNILRVISINSETLYYAIFSVIYFLLYRVDTFSILSRSVRQWSIKNQYFCSAVSRLILIFLVVNLSLSRQVSPQCLDYVLTASFCIHLTLDTIQVSLNTDRIVKWTKTAEHSPLTRQATCV
jgi:hypothetical protein